MINGAVSNANYLRLSVRIAFKESIGRRDNIFIDFKLSSLNINRHNFSFVAYLNLLANTRLVKALSTLSKLFFAITSLANLYKLTSQQLADLILAWRANWQITRN
jgi:hypothetical protein